MQHPQSSQWLEQNQGLCICFPKDLGTEDKKRFLNHLGDNISSWFEDRSSFSK